MTLPRLAALLPLLLAATLSGCSMFEGDPTDGPTPTAPRVRNATPGFREISARYNARVARLDRIAARADLTVTRPDPEGAEQTDQIEGYLQFRRPRFLNLRIDKVGSTLFIMGSNADRYWWFDVSDQNRGWSGTHEKARREVVERFGVPVQPADLAELLGVLPLDPAAAAKISWTADGRRVRVVVPGTQGPRRLELDPVTFEPQRIELLDSAGAVAVAAELSRYEIAPVRGDTRATPKLATVFDVRIPSQATSITIKLTGVENPGDRQKDANFDFDLLVDRYGVASVENLDELKPREPRRKSP